MLLETNLWRKCSDLFMLHFFCIFFMFDSSSVFQKFYLLKKKDMEQLLGKFL